MLMKTAFTSGSRKVIPTPMAAFLALAPPPPSRKFAGCDEVNESELNAKGCRRDARLAASRDECIHGRHCQSRTVTEAPDITTGRVGVSGCLDVKHAFLQKTAQIAQIGQCDASWLAHCFGFELGRVLL